MKTFTRIAAALIAVTLIAVPTFAQRGQADFTRFVALGDSYGAGVSSNSLNERHQVFSWPAIIARQAGLTLCQPNAAANAGCFAQPLVTRPGIGPEMQLATVVPSVSFVTPAAQGSPVMLQFARPYNNLAIPGAKVGDLTTLTGAQQPGPGETAKSFAQFILRGHGTAVQQALAQQPTFVAVWIGGNDALGSVLAATPALLTPLDVFTTNYNALLDQLVAGAPGAGMVVGNLPTNPLALPYAATIPPFIVDPATRQPILGPNGQPIYYIADLGGGNIGQLPAGSLVVLPAQAKIATGFGMPAVPPFSNFPNAGRPLADTDVITPTELQAIVTRVNEYNTVIAQAAAARNIPVADIKGLFDRIAVNPLTGAGGLNIGPFRVTSSFVTGGFFSFDGFHPTDLGYLLFANEFIRTINEAYETQIPVAGISQIFANNGAFFPETEDGQMVTNAENFAISAEVARAIKMQWAPLTPREAIAANDELQPTTGGQLQRQQQ